jgi:8-oxo-dGTP diphosphatase
MPASPIDTVAAVIIRQASGGAEVLLTLRAGEPFAGRWCIPGGHLNEGENWQEAVQREVLEETGVAFSPRFLGSFAEEIPELDIDAMVRVYEGVAESEAVADEVEVTELRWFPIEEALAMGLAFKHNEILQAYAWRNEPPERMGDRRSEFEALRAEVTLRIDLRQQALNLALTGTGLLIGFAAGDLADPVILFLLPWLMLPIATMWVHHDLRIKQIGEFVRERIEPALPGLSWEHALQQRYERLSGWRRIYKAFAELASLGVFIIIDVVSVAAAILLRIALETAGGSVSTPWWVYFASVGAAVLPLLATIMLVRERRAGYRMATRARRKAARSREHSS